MFACRVLGACVLAVLLYLPVAGQKVPNQKSASAAMASYEAPQSEHENLDLTMYQRIRDEGIGHSRVMES